MRRSKRASMQLSINAIVILVMAMAVLGIGLGLIRGVLAPAQGNLEDALGKVDLSEMATSSKTIANVPQSLRMKASSANELVVSFYNTGLESCSDYSTVRLNCGEYVATAYDGVLSVPAPQGEATTLLAIVKPSTVDGTVPDGKGAISSQACKVEVICSDAVIAAEDLVDADGALKTLADKPATSGAIVPYVADSYAAFVKFG